jgi:REP element-mobilizing transposase RayT
MQVEPLNTLSWAYQLHYYLCFRTRVRKPFSASQLDVTIDEICRRHQYHLLRSKTYPDHLRCLISLQPTQKISDVIRTEQWTTFCREE